MSLMMVDRNDSRSPRAVGSYLIAVLLTLLFGTACSSRAAGTASSAASRGTVPHGPPRSAPSPLTRTSLPTGPTVAESSAVPSAIASTPTPTLTAGSGDKLIITQDDQRKSIQLSVGAIIEFDLRADGVPTGTTVESARTFDPTILQELSGSAGPGSASTAVYRAVGPGTAFVLARITLPCPTAPARLCQQAVEAFGFDVQVMSPK